MRRSQRICESCRPVWLTLYIVYGSCAKVTCVSSWQCKLGSMFLNRQLFHFFDSSTTTSADSSPGSGVSTDLYTGTVTWNDTPADENSTLSYSTSTNTDVTTAHNVTEFSTEATTWNGTSSNETHTSDYVSTGNYSTEFNSNSTTESWNDNDTTTWNYTTGYENTTSEFQSTSTYGTPGTAPVISLGSQPAPTSSIPQTTAEQITGGTSNAGGVPTTLVSSDQTSSPDPGTTHPPTSSETSPGQMSTTQPPSGPDSTPSTNIAPITVDTSSTTSEVVTESTVTLSTTSEPPGLDNTSISEQPGLDNTSTSDNDTWTTNPVNTNSTELESTTETQPETSTRATELPTSTPDSTPGIETTPTTPHPSTTTVPSTTIQDTSITTPTTNPEYSTAQTGETSSALVSSEQPSTGATPLRNTTQGLPPRGPQRPRFQPQAPPQSPQRHRFQPPGTTPVSESPQRPQFQIQAPLLSPGFNPTHSLRRNVFGFNPRPHHRRTNINRHFKHTVCFLWASVHNGAAWIHFDIECSLHIDGPPLNPRWQHNADHDRDFNTTHRFIRTQSIVRLHTRRRDWAINIRASRYPNNGCSNRRYFNNNIWNRNYNSPNYNSPNDRIPQLQHLKLKLHLPQLQTPQRQYPPTTISPITTSETETTSSPTTTSPTTQSPITTSETETTSSSTTISPTTTSTPTTAHQTSASEATPSPTTPPPTTPLPHNSFSRHTTCLYSNSNGDLGEHRRDWTSSWHPNNTDCFCGYYRSKPKLGVSGLRGDNFVGSRIPQPVVGWRDRRHCCRKCRGCRDCRGRRRVSGILAEEEKVSRIF